MTTKELMDFLKKFPNDTEVKVPVIKYYDDIVDWKWEDLDEEDHIELIDYKLYLGDF